MNTWKIIAGVLVAMVVAVVAIGVVAAQTPTTNPTAAPNQNQNFWTQMSNWIGNCFRWRTGQVNTGTGVQAPQVTTPTQPAGPSTTATPTPNQGYYYGYGPCLRWR